MASPTDSSPHFPFDVDLDVHGVVPAGLSGRLVGVDREGVGHWVHLRDGRVSYQRRHFGTDAVVRHLVALGGSVLAFGDDVPSYELSTHSDDLCRVDLAGHGRVVTSRPKLAPATGELHLVARDACGVQAHVVVSAGALTRHNRPILDAPSRITDLALTRDHVVFVADGFAGIAPRDGEARTRWMPTGMAGPDLVHAQAEAETVVVLALTPLLERWTLHPDARSIQRQVLDPTPRRFAHCGNEGVGGVLARLWTTGGETIGQHDLLSSRHLYCSLWPAEPGDLLFVADAIRDDVADGGWLVGFVHEPSGATELRVIDANDIDGSAMAAIPIPHSVSRGLRCTWIPGPQQ